MHPALMSVVVSFVAGSMMDLAMAQDRITPDVVYGHKDGLAMTLDVLRPEQSNGKGVLFMVSGGWYSAWKPPTEYMPFFAPLLQDGFTVFAVRHGSSPRYSIAEAVADVRRAVRYVRFNASELGVDPDHLGVFGMSAGGHLSLMLATASDAGNPASRDPIEQTSNRVQCVAAFVAPTDLQVVALGGTERLPDHEQFPGLRISIDSARDVSPIEFVSDDDPPALLLAGVQDDLVPVVHSQRMHAALKEVRVVCRLVEYPESGHGFRPEDAADGLQKMTEWFHQHLVEAASPAAQSSEPRE